MPLASLPFPPPYVPCQHRELGGGLAAGTVTSNGGTNKEVICLNYARFVTIRIKTTGNGGSLQLDYIRPRATEPTMLGPGGIDPTKVAVYTAPASPAALTVTAAGTEYSMTVTTNGEMYALLTYTGATGAGTIAYVDVSGV